ncbi:MAG: SDR family oxidoreductase [Chromatiales bacterium]|nr:SDR family oxidoreductase [Chromatiales bacterium]
MQLAGKVALVSGGSRGIGAAVVRRFVAEGAYVAVGDIELTAAQAVAADASSAGMACAMQLDVTRAEDWESAVSALVADRGGVDILVNNAGIYQRKSLEDIEESDWDQVMAVNAKGPFLGAKAVMAAMRARGGGAIVNISSTAGIRASVSTHYGASKGAVRLMTKSVALLGAKDRIRCNSVHPGPVDTQMGYAALPEPIRDERLGRVPLGRFAAPDEIANAVLFLACEESSFVTGTELIVDGGATIA